MFDFLDENKILIPISFVILLIIISGILYYYNTNKGQTAEDIDAKIIKSLEEGSIEERKKFY